MTTKKGTANDNVLVGSNAADKIYGLGGNDLITGGGGNDKIWAGDNGAISHPGMWDNVDGGAGNDVIYGGAGGDYLQGGNGLDRLFGGDDDDFLFGNNGKDAISGDDGNDIISGDKGKDMLFGDDGNDTLMAIYGNDQMDGGKGDDKFFTGRDNVTATDKAGNDEYHIENPDASPTIYDKTGNDKIIFDYDQTNHISITADMMTFTRDGYDLHITIDGFHGDTVLSSYFMGKNHRIETLMDNDTTDHPDGFSLSGLSELKHSGDSIDGTHLWDLG